MFLIHPTSSSPAILQGIKGINYRRGKKNGKEIQLSVPDNQEVHPIRKFADIVTSSRGFDQEVLQKEFNANMTYQCQWKDGIRDGFRREWFLFLSFLS